ncbi:MAG: trehalase family glycosidase [Lentisphaeria bacterium]|jgi:putative isomerase
MTHHPAFQHHSERLLDFICGQTAAIHREAQGCLKHPFLVPGGLFHDELWDWDSFWIVEGLRPLKGRLAPDAREKFLLHAMGSWINFFDHQTPEGTLPIMMKAGMGDFFGCTTVGGTEKNQAKPVFAQFARGIAEFAGDFRWLAPYYGPLKKFLQRWRSRYGTDCGLLVWGSDAAIGVDNDPTTYGRPEFSSANLLLNCLFYQELGALGTIAKALGREADLEGLADEAERLKAAIRRECWDESDSFFYTVDVQCRDHRHEHFPQINRGMEMTWRTLPQKIKLFTGFLPMWCGIATPEQARLLVEGHLRNPAEFDARYGLPSLSKRERMYDPATDSANPSNWLGPVWIVANYMVYEGLRRYGYHADAAAVAGKIVTLLGEDLERHGVLHECYHPDTGKPNFNAGFLSWNVLAGAMIAQETMGRRMAAGGA